MAALPCPAQQPFLHSLPQPGRGATVVIAQHHWLLVLTGILSCLQAESPAALCPREQTGQGCGRIVDGQWHSAHQVPDSCDGLHHPAGKAGPVPVLMRGCAPDVSTLGAPLVCNWVAGQIGKQAGCWLVGVGVGMQACMFGAWTALC